MNNSEMIHFNIPLITGKEIEYINQAIKNKNLSGDGYFTQLVSKKLISETKALKVLLTTSCTHALEMAAMLIDIQPGDEVIIPSFTFVSTSNPFVLRGAKIIFIDIRPDTMNIDEELIEPAITERTKAIVPVHYAGVGCEMDKIMNIAEKYNLWVVEDAAQSMLAYYNNKHLGTFGHLGCISFHRYKKY